MSLYISFSRAISILQLKCSVALQKTPTQTEGGELLGLLSSNLSHVQGPRLQVQVYQMGLHFISQLDHTDHSALANQTYRWGIQQRNLVGVELDDDKVLLVRGQADRVGRILSEAAPPRPQPVPGDGVKDLDPLIPPVGHPHPLGVVHGHAVGDVELSQALSFLSVHPQHLLLFGQLDEAVVHATVAVHNVHLSGVVDKDLSRLVELQRAQPRACPPLCTEHLTNTRKYSTPSNSWLF